MSIIKFTVAEFTAEPGSATPVSAPIGTPISNVRVKSVLAQDGKTKTGLWECTPGRWRRQVTQAEFCHFLEGDCTFSPDEGEPVEIRAGDVLFFPANTKGVWEIRSQARKIYVVFE
jgi:uncharacterized cupin superfamily protein